MRLRDLRLDYHQSITMKAYHVPFLLESRDGGEVHFGCAARQILFSGTTPAWSIIFKAPATRFVRSVGDRCQSGPDDLITHVAACGCLLGSVVIAEDAGSIL